MTYLGSDIFIRSSFIKVDLQGKPDSDVFNEEIVSKCLKLSYRFPIFLALALGSAASGFAAADVCALTIEVTGNGGQPAIARVLVSDASSKLVADVQTDAEGKAKVCDLGFGDHHVEINTPFCHSVSIDKVRFVDPHPLYFKLELSSCSVPEEGAVVGTGCSVYFRVRSEEEKPVGGATVESYGDPRFQQKADSYGRLHRLIPLGNTGALVTAQAPGFEPSEFHVQCEGHMYREQLITLLKKK